MFSRRKLNKFLMNGTSRRDVSLTTSGVSKSSDSPPDPPTTPSNFLIPSGPILDVGSNLPGLIQVDMSNSSEPALPDPPTLRLARASGEITPQARESDSGPVSAVSAEAQLVPPHESVMSFNTNTVASTAALPGVKKDGWARLKACLRLMNQSAGVFGPLKAAVDELVGCIEIYERVANGRDEFNVLQAELEGIFKDLEQYFSWETPSIVTDSMESLCRSIVKELGYVKGKQDRHTKRRYNEAEEDADEVLACYRRIQGHLQRLSLNANISMWRIADEQATDARLDRLTPSFSACYNSRQAVELKRGACTPGTRIDVLGHIHGWVYDHAAGPVYWLNGMAGTGKTTIAYSLCNELDVTHNLGASFFCSRSLPECRDVNQIIPSIAYQLAHFSRPFRFALSRVLEKERNVHTRLLHIQFEVLVVKPLVEVIETLPENLLVVIDALDECDDKRSTEQILEALLTKTSDLPIKFFITSRPEAQIRDQMGRQDSQQLISRLVLHELDKGMVQGDIETYLRVALGRVKPSEPQIAALVQRAGILFIYAATVVRYVGYDNFGRNPISRLEVILSISTSAERGTYQEIDELYTVEGQERNDMKQVLNTVLCAREPLTIGVISGILDLRDVERVNAALRPLWSVLHVVESNELVTTLHASFPDYMFDPDRSNGYFCDQAAQDHALTKRCFNCIKNATPQFNICGLESSYVRDNQIDNLSARVEKAISPELRYACRHWAAHLKRAKGLSDLVEPVEDFLSVRLLLWMEIMNLQKRMDTGVGVILQAEEWCMVHSGELTKLAHDAWRFVAAFTSSPVSQSTPHIYVSMLPFWPESSPIAKRYAKRIRSPPVPRGPSIARRRLELLATWPVEEGVGGVAWSPNGNRVALAIGQQIFVQDSFTGQIIKGPLKQGSSSFRSIGFSPDSTRIVAGSNDGAVGVWDAETGGMVLGPLKAHTESVTSVAFAPDGTRIVSGSEDTTLCMWDAMKGHVILGPLEGHADFVTSVAFSPDGNRIVSGSDDETIRLWGTQTGETVLGPLKGHTQSVASVAFSPDGTRVISGSWDRTIRIWDAQSGQLVLDPLEGDSQAVISLAFSLDGTRIVSGTYDSTIWMWDAQSGQMTLGPLEGHTQSVTSVAISPDGTRIISGSSDKTIRMWNTRSEHTALPPLEGPTRLITLVTFSPDGTRIVSASYDSTICVWDVQSQQMMLGPLKGHTDCIKSVAFLFDGSRIVSGSDDKTIRVWDTRSGRTVLGPLKGHTKPITSVAFSHNGTRIVSGSRDRTIQIWDSRYGHKILAPFKGHSHWVTSVAFSPDDARIVSGSYDRTICVWDSQRGRIVLGPLEGHADWVLSVVFSPNGTRIVSSSCDNTLCVWDAQTGKLVLGPLKGHTDWVSSIAFSPDGFYVVSGSWDMTICIWDTQSGDIVVGPLKGHTSWVMSVAFSPDGVYIVSGSSDKSIRLWDARVKQAGTLCSRSGLTAASAWIINPDGWVINQDNESRLLIWVPSDLHPVLLPSQNIFSISNVASVGLDFTDARIGEHWVECYHSV